MSGRRPSGQADHLRLADSLLTAVAESLSSLQRLLREVHGEIESARREEEEFARDDEIRALRREIDQLREGMGSRAVIERAKGILMHTHDVSEAQSFELLNEMSQRHHRKLRDVAADVVNDSSLRPGLTAVHPAADGPGHGPRPASPGTGSEERPVVVRHPGPAATGSQQAQS